MVNGKFHQVNKVLIMAFINKKQLVLVLFLVSSISFADYPASNNLNMGAGNTFESTISKGATSASTKVMKISDKTLDKLEFKFSGASAWLNKQGDWNIKGKVKHNRIRCGNYQLGIKFGAGKSGCDEVVWKTDYQYGTNVKQCNSATLEHIGGGNFYELADNISTITCAKVDVRCFGNGCSK